MQRPLIAPSVLAADFANLESEVKVINQSQADYFHIDIMDGVFVPNISFGFPVCDAIFQYSTKPMDFHLMIVHPEKYLKECRNVGAQIITVHLEACDHLHRVIEEIKALDCKAGVALNPHTNINLLEDVIKDLDLVCVMSVNPGFGGQKFIPHTLEKIRRLKELIVDNESTALIEVDGGVNQSNAAELVSVGADILVAGSFVFQSENPIDTIAGLKALGE